MIVQSLQDKVAVVTGGAGGIGRATALALAKAGCHVAVADINGEGAERTAAVVRQTGREASAWAVDVADRAAMERFAADVFERHRAVHIVINNAGVSVASSFSEHSIEDFEWIVGINFWGVVYGCKFFLPYIQQQGEGHIVNVSSIFGLAGFPNQSSYCATKFAVRGLSESLWVELRDSNIGVTSVHPAGVRTDIARSARSNDAGYRDASVAIIERAGVPPEECAARILLAIRNNRQRILVARGARLVEFVKRLSPTFGQHLVRLAHRRTFQ